jgi:hypothetical protein
MEDKKHQATIYITEEDKWMIKKLMAKNLLLGENASITDVIRKVLKEAYEREFNAN